MTKKTASELIKGYKGSSISFSQKEKYLDIYKRLREKEQQNDSEVVKEKVEAPVSEVVVQKKEKTEAKVNTASSTSYPRLRTDEDHIQFSTKLLVAFEKLMKKFNSENSGKKVFSNKIRECFVQTARHCELNKIAGKKKTNLCFASVNLYLRNKVEGSEGELSDDDFAIAENQIEEFDLGHEFNSLSDLYIVDDKQENRVY